MVDPKLTLYWQNVLIKSEFQSKPTSKAESMSSFSMKLYECLAMKSRFKNIEKALLTTALDQFPLIFGEFLRRAFLFIEAVDRLVISYLRDNLNACSNGDGLRIKRTHAFAIRTRNFLTIIGNEEFTRYLMKNSEVLLRSFENLVLSRSWFEFDWIVVDTRVNTSITAKFENAWSGIYHGVQPYIHVPLRLAPHCRCTSFSVDQDECSQKAVSLSSSNTAHPTIREISSIKDSFQTTRTNGMKRIEDQQTVQAQRTCDMIFRGSSSSSLGSSDIVVKKVLSYTDIITNDDKRSKDENKENEYTIPLFSILGKIAFPCKGRQLAIILLLFTTNCVSNTNASSDVKRVIGTYQTLSTESCSRELYFKKPCPPPSNFEMLMNLCEYQCEPGYKPQCFTVENGIDEKGSVYICLSSNLTCPAGVRWWPFLTNKTLTHVTIIEEECPAVYFQSTNSNCFDACKDKHKDTSNLPKELLIYSKGDAKSPTMVYCNFKENYFNANGDFLIDLNAFMEHDRSFCSNIEYAKSPCPENKQILPNGRCVTPCEEGSEIDVYANFTCTTSIATIKVTSSTAGTPPTTTITSSPKTSTTSDDKDKVRTDEDNTSAEKDKMVNTFIGVGVAVVILALLALAIIIYCYCKKEKNSHKGGQAMDVERKQLEGSDRASVVKAPSYIVHNKTHAEHVIHVGDHSSVQIHHHYPGSSLSANQSTNRENQSTGDDNTDGREVAENVKPIVRFSNDPDEDADDDDSKSTDGTETTALLIREGGKSSDKKLTASPYGSQDDEDPANGAIDSNITEPLLASFETNDSGNIDKENTEIKTVLTKPTYSGSMITLTDQTYSESEDNVTDKTQIKTINTDTTLNSSDGKWTTNNNISNIHSNELDLNATERKSLYHENGISNTMETPRMSLLKDIESNDERANNESADTASASTDIGANHRMAILKESHDLCDDSMNTEDKTKLKELFGPSNTERYGLEPACNLRLHVPANTEDTEGMEMHKEYDWNLGHSRLISNSLSDERISVSDKSLEGQVSTRSSSG